MFFEKGGEFMIKISGGYVPVNPNFVLSKISTKAKIDVELEGILAVLQNILLRGTPTNPSVFLKDELGIPKKEDKYLYSKSTKKMSWKKTIKGGSTNPAIEFYKKLCDNHQDAFCFLPECKLNEIIFDEQIKNSYAVDFYSPFHRFVVEIDGWQHNSGVQRINDEQRNRICRDRGINFVRIPTKDFENEEKILEIIKSIPKASEKFGFVDKDELSENQKIYSYIFRFQILLIELLSKGHIKLNDSVVKLSLIYNDDADIVMRALKLACEDFKKWLEQLYALTDKTICFPEMVVEENSEICIDLDLYNHYDESFYEEEKTIKVRNDYFPYDKDSFAITESIVAKDKIILGKFCQYKNYYKVKTSDFRFNDVNDQNDVHRESLRFFLKNIFNHEDFRPKQIEIIANGLSAKKGVIGLLPTGSGKSVCYQLVSFLTPTITLVITPLKLLMNDQKENLYRRNSIMSAYQIHAEEKGNQNVFAQSQAKILYISPERFFSKDFVDIIKSISIGQIVVDEVHCLSEWGHDFRTSYLLLFAFLKKSYLSKNLLLMGTSATASPRVIYDIKQEFKKIKNDIIEIKATSISRPELSFNVVRVENDGQAKENKVLELVEKAYLNKEKVLIFCAFRKDARNLQCKLNEKNPEYEAQSYYSGNLEKENCDDNDQQKQEAYEKFASGKSKVLAATKAFGMGIDIQDIRHTIHFDIASSVESIYQEMGRAGRDGKKSYCTVVFEDKKQAKQKIEALFEEGLYIEKLKKQKESDKSLRSYGAISKQLIFLIKDNKDYMEWSDFIYIVYRFLSNEKRTEDFALSDFETFLKAEDPKAEVDNLQIKFEKALYKLYTLGMIDLWSVSYANGSIKNPIYSQIVMYDFSPKVQLEKLESHIARFGGRKYKYDSQANGETLKSYITALCKWDNENFLNYRWKSLYTLYKMVSEFQNSEIFASRIEKYFLDSEDLERIIITQSSYKEWLEILSRTESDTLLYQLERYSLDYPNNPAIDFLQGMLAIKNGVLKQVMKQRFKNVLIEIFSKSDVQNLSVLEDCIIHFGSDNDSKKRFLIFLSDSFPSVMKNTDMKKYLESFDAKTALELLNRITYSSIYESLKRLKLSLGDNI